MGGFAGIFLDPPYADAIRAKGLYQEDSGSVTEVVRAWCVEAGKNPKNRIVLAGYDVEHAALEAHGWTAHDWFVKDSYLAGGYGDQQHRERLWASPHCLPLDNHPAQGALF
jgi:hypothetical protein